MSFIISLQRLNRFSLALRRLSCIFSQTPGKSIGQAAHLVDAGDFISNFQAAVPHFGDPGAPQGGLAEATHSRKIAKNQTLFLVAAVSYG